MAPEAHASEGDSAPTWRRYLLDGLLKASALLMTIVLPPLVIQTRSYERIGWTSLVVLAYVLVLIACLVQRLPYRVRAVGLLFGLASVSWLGFIRVGFQIGPGLGSAMAVVLTGLLLGRRAMAFAYALMLLMLLGIGYLHSQNAGVLIARHANDPSVFSNWVRSAFAFALFGGVLSLAVMFVVLRIERMLLVRTEALEALRAEQSQRAGAERALERANQQILQMQKLEALGRLAGGVAHDFNNALVVILGWTDLLRTKTLNEDELDKALDEIASAADSAARLTQQLLSFGRKAVHVPQSVALDRLVARWAETLARLMPDNVKVRCDLPSDVPAVLIDPGQMHQVLVNLCLNARDAMPHGGELTISVRSARITQAMDLPAGEWVSLSVSDTGVGMDAHTLKNAFEPFFSTKGELGTGLGLSSVYGIVQQTGGHVSVESEQGKGTTFTLLLPLSHEVGVPASGQELVVHAARTATILVAEDEPSVRRLIVEALKADGHRVLEAENGDAALSLARDTRREDGAIDLLCTDGIMPGLPSEELIGQFRRLFPSSAVLVCSGHIAAQGLRAGVARRELRFLPKPFTGAELIAAVSASLSAVD